MKLIVEEVFIERDFSAAENHAKYLRAQFPAPKYRVRRTNRDRDIRTGKWRQYVVTVYRVQKGKRNKS